MLTLGSYNVHRCVGRDGRLDPGRISAVIDELEADVLALQEVEWGGPGGTALLQHLAERMDAEPIYGMTLLRGDTAYGNVLLVRGEVRSLRRHDLSVPGREPRGAIDARGKVRGHPLRVLSTHFGLSRRERRCQAGMLAERIGEDPAPPILLLGDLNEWIPWARSLRPLRAWLRPARAPGTFPAGLPILALDRIWWHCGQGGRLKVRRHGGALARRASDHRPLRAVLRLPAR